MESYRQQRCEPPGGGRQKSHRKKGSVAEEGDRKLKFLNIRTLTDDVLDRFASIRMPGTKKERPYLSQAKPSLPSDWSNSSEFEDIPCKITSEKEILALFEKMMEDMNLNEDKKTPLREKDINLKREMVIQYISTASKPGSLKSNHQISPQEFLSELKTGTVDERLFACLESLRVSLTSNPVRSGKEERGVHIFMKKGASKMNSDQTAMGKNICCCQCVTTGGRPWVRALCLSGAQEFGKYMGKVCN